jgi:hypothetical protein
VRHKELRLLAEQQHAGNSRLAARRQRANGLQ